MSNDIWRQVSNLPPAHWVTGLALWHQPPFSWVGDLLNVVFTQQLLQWTESRVAWLLVTCVAVGVMTFEFLWWSWAWIRGRQINYDDHKATYWTTGPHAGQLKANPINLRKARARRYGWPLVGLPLYLVAVGMYLWYLLWPGDASRLLLAVLWFCFAPVRRTLLIAVARKVYRANNPNDRLGTTLFEDVYNYFYTGVARPFEKRRYVEPPFEDTGMIYKALNWGHATFGRYGTFWRLWRFWNFLRFWGLLVEAVIAFYWPIAAIVAPFFYMWAVSDYQDWVNPWWRRHRKSEYHGKVIKGEVLKTDGPS